MLDLFTPLVDENKFHPNFKEMLKDEYPFARDLLQSWTVDFIDRDHKFVKEFQTTFNSSFWELYLFKVFKSYGFEIDLSHPYPDFVIKKPYEVSFEAVISNNSMIENPEFMRDYSSSSPNIDEIVRTATIRLANAIIYKYNKYKEHYSKSDIVKGKPFILAVAPFEQPFFWEQTNRAINRVLYGLSGFKYKDPNNRIAPEIVSPIIDLFIEKDNGSEIPLGFFRDTQMEEVSAILFSNVATFGKLRALTKDKDPRPMFFSYSKFNRNGWRPNAALFVPKNLYSETLEDGINLYLNPFAKYPLPKEFVDIFQGWSSFDVSTNLPSGDSKDGDLYNRMVSTMKFF